jgi:hypothetical protein
MQDLLTQLATLHRPRLLTRAARIASQSYRRSAVLPRILGYGMTPRTGPALVTLMALEHEVNDKRKAGDASYSIASHVEILSAIMGESQILRAQSRPQPVPSEVSEPT